MKGRGVSGFSDLQVALETAPTPGRIGGRGAWWAGSGSGIVTAPSRWRKDEDQGQGRG